MPKQTASNVDVLDDVNRQCAKASSARALRPSPIFCVPQSYLAWRGVMKDEMEAVPRGDDKTVSPSKLRI